MTERNRKIMLFICSVIVVSFIALYEGHFLFTKHERAPGVKDDIAEKTHAPISSPRPFPVEYRYEETIIHGAEQKINLLELDLSSGRIEVKPVLSFDSIFGFEKLSVMASRTKAYAAINAGFFHEYGQPSGMVAIDGKLVSNSTGKYPVLYITGNKAELKEISAELWVLSGERRIRVNNINIPGNPGEIILYTREYGTDNRLNADNLSIVIENRRVTGVVKTSGKVDIPEGGMVLTWVGPLKTGAEDFPFKQGNGIEFQVQPDLKNGAQAYECGSWLVRDGKIVIGDRDEWVGVLTNRDPRTAVGIKNDGKLVLLTVDGRQPGYSLGMTAKELAQYFLGNGVSNAAMLDGGASTEMIVDGKMVNKPSFKGQERPLGGAIVVKLTMDN